MYVTTGGELLSTSVQGCPADLSFIANTTTSAALQLSTNLSASQEDSFLYQMYSISYMYYGVFGTILTVAVGLVFSLATWTNADPCNTKMLHPAVRWLSSRSLFGGKRMGSFDLGGKAQPKAQLATPGTDATVAGKISDKS
ncbi:uncharacterized protein LOC129742324 [Uranotaenia lowii]|uniref:uncharacterized protein LOC129742324 n=1 Tax=Uranotaenia lowii TaxID=190385 RepID=UPI00247A45A1|nr:uncharacterized protein LOC129742324 [Uranotaenia lowii]